MMALAVEGGPAEIAGKPIDAAVARAPPPVPLISQPILVVVIVVIVVVVVVLGRIASACQLACYHAIALSEKAGRHLVLGNLAERIVVLAFGGGVVVLTSNEMLALVLAVVFVMVVTQVNLSERLALDCLGVVVVVAVEVGAAILTSLCVLEGGVGLARGFDVALGSGAGPASSREAGGEAVARARRGG